MMRTVATGIVCAALLSATVAWCGLPVFVTPCSKTTCKALDDDAALPSGPVGVSVVVVISDSTECPGKCSTLNTPTARLHVIGNYYDLWCKVWGGQYCSYRGRR